MALTGDFAKLAKLIQRLGKLGKGDDLTRVTQAMGEEALQLLQRGFAQETDPYGAKWAPHSPKTKSKRGSRILRYTGAMYKAWSLVADRTKFTITNGTTYAAVHQYGASYVAGAGHRFRNKKGRFQKADVAEANAAKRKRGAVPVSFHGSHRIVIPMRRMFPVMQLGLGTWQSRLLRTGASEVRRMLRGK